MAPPEADVKALASSFSSWASIERQEGTQATHGLTFPLAVVQALGRSHGLEMVAEERAEAPASSFDAIFIGLLDTRCAIAAAEHFRRWGIPLRASERRPVGSYPLVWMGGQGLRNPRPYGPIADLIVMGDAEPVLPALLAAWERLGNTGALLDEAASLAGVWVPERMDPERQAVRLLEADDIGVTQREDVRVSLDGSRRIEIARGCRSKCAFCSLGWRTRYREAPVGDVIAALQASPRRVHLQAGDAESYSQIDELRRELLRLDSSDLGWTGRLDAVLDNPDADVRAQKRYAYGVEACSHRIRRAIGKPKLTDEYLIQSTTEMLNASPAGSVGRALWHMIAGWPTERPDDVLSLYRVFDGIEDGLRHKRALTVNWQPLQPLPGTPSQWLAAGAGARGMRDRTRLWGRGRRGRLIVRSNAGRSDEMAALCAILGRADDRGADLIEAMGRGRVSVPEAERIAGQTAGVLPLDTALPWDFVETGYGPAALRRAHQVMMDRLKRG